MLEHVRDPASVPRTHELIRVELVMIGAAAPSYVLVHAAVVVPVVDERDHQLDAQLAGSVDRIVETLETIGTVVERRCGPVPVLKVHAVVLPLAVAVRGARVVLIANLE